MSQLSEMDHLPPKFDKKAENKAETEMKSNKSVETALEYVSNKSSPARNDEANISNLNKSEHACTIDVNNPSYEGSEANEKFVYLDGLKIASSGHTNPGSPVPLSMKTSCCDPSDPVPLDVDGTHGALATWPNSSSEFGSDKLDRPNPQTSTPEETKYSDDVLFVDSRNAKGKYSSDSSCDLSGMPSVKSTAESSGIGASSDYNSLLDESVERYQEDSNLTEDAIEPSKFKRRSFYRTSFDELRSIGKGSFGSVYEVRHKIDNSNYAVKCVELTKNVDAKTTIKEARTLARFSHQNIIRYYNSWIDTSSSRTIKYLCIQMELCKQTLKEWLQNVDVDELKKNRLQIVYQISDGLAYIHSQNYIHRDLKPANIFIALNNNIKIGDFGLVTSWKRGGSDQFHRSPGAGTRLYMAPEQISDVYNHKVDIYSLGLILFELHVPALQFGTNHEKQKIWTEAKVCDFPIEFTRNFPKVTKQLNMMLNVDSTIRPDAIQVQNFIWNLSTEVIFE